MGRSATWAVTDRGNASVARVAVRTLRTRLEAVWSELTGACRTRHEPERVHQLRVATRRTIAALDAFRDLVPARRQTWFVKRLRRIRRAAGDTRDLDVLTSRLTGAESEAAAGRSSLAERARDRLITMLARRRDVSRQPIREIRDELAAADWAGHVERLLDEVAVAGAGDTFGSYARRRFRPIMERFFARADRRLSDAAEIHRLRIEGKKLRYAMEIFAGVFPAPVRASCQQALERLQESLGDFTDHAAAADRFRRWSREGSARVDRKALVALRKAEDRQAEKARRAFVKWWKPSRRRALRKRFERTLWQDSA